MYIVYCIIMTHANPNDKIPTAVTKTRRPSSTIPTIPTRRSPPRRTIGARHQTPLLASINGGTRRRKRRKGKKGKKREIPI